MKILLFGKAGQLGWELNHLLASLGEVSAFSSKELDVKNFSELKNTINNVKPNLIINASAYTAVDQAEAEPELAMQINAHAPAVMAECAKKLNAVFIHYSTDYVFDGTKNIPYNEKDLTNPLNVYGKSKMDGEQAIGQIGGVHLILRTSWVYSMRGENFVTKVLSWARQKEPIQVVTDQIGSPTWARALANITCQMITHSLPMGMDYFSNKSGVYHLGGLGSVSRFDFAREILRLNTERELVTKNLIPSLTSNFPTPARRPLFTALDCSHFENVFGIQLAHWQEALQLAFVK
jgi:dTDP-4-dehydrorhamnose reductase